MRLLTMKGMRVPRALLDYVNKVLVDARLCGGEEQQLAYVRRTLTATFERRKIARAWWEVREEHGVPEVRVVFPGVHETLCVLVVQAGPAPLTPEDMERAHAVVGRPEYWCRAKLLSALEAARVKGVLREVLDEMEVSTQQANTIEQHLEQYWRRS